MGELFSPATRVLPRIGEAVLRGITALAAVLVSSLLGILVYELYLVPTFGYPAGFSVLGTLGITAYVSAKIGDVMRLPEEDRAEFLEQTDGVSPLKALISILFFSTAMALGGIAAFYATPYLPAWMVLQVAAFYPLADTYLGNKAISPSLLVVGLFGLFALVVIYAAQLVLDAKKALNRAARRGLHVPGFPVLEVLIKETPINRLRRLRW